MASIEQNDTYLVNLRSLIESETTLRKHGYITRPLTQDELLLKRRCIGCGKAMSQLVVKGNSPSQKDDAVNEVATMAQSALPLHDLQSSNRHSPAAKPLAMGLHPSEATTPRLGPMIRCRYHPGEVVQKYWTCCSQHVTAKPCGGSENHIPQTFTNKELANQYQLHATPIISKFEEARAAVAIDCEIGTAKSGDSVVIRVTLIDYFSGEILVNNIVDPDVPMHHLNTRFSGVSWADIRNAKRQKACLKGTAGARRQIWRFVGPDTIVVGHGASNDLRTLKWIHGSIVDSYVTEFGFRAKFMDAEKKQKTEDVGDVVAIPTEPRKRSLLLDNKDDLKLQAPHNVPGTYGEIAVAKVPRAKRDNPDGLSLKSLVKKRLGKDIQTGGKAGHDSLEDAVGARDLVHWIIVNRNHI